MGDRARFRGSRGTAYVRSDAGINFLEEATSGPPRASVVRRGGVAGKGPRIIVRVLISVVPTIYRETLTHILRRHRPNDEVRPADPEVLDQETSSFRPHLIVCNDNAPEVQEVHVPSWVVIRYHDHLSASVFLAGQDARLIQDITMEDLFGVIDETERLVVRG